MKQANWVITGAAAAVSWASAAVAQMPDLDEIVRISLLPGWKMENGHRMGALRVDLAPGWKTYWRIAGSAGVPPMFDWSRSSNLARVTIHWPRPDVLKEAGYEVIGYEGQLILPIEFSARDPHAPITLRAQLKLGVCKEVCIPVKLPVQADGVDGPEDENFLIRLALDDQIVAASSAGFKLVSCKTSKGEDGLRLRARFRLPANAAMPQAAVIETANPDIWVAPVKLARNGDELVTETELVAMSDQPLAPDLSKLRITLIGKGLAVEKRGCPDSQ